MVQKLWRFKKKSYFDTKFDVDRDRRTTPFFKHFRFTYHPLRQLWLITALLQQNLLDFQAFYFIRYNNISRINRIHCLLSSLQQITREKWIGSEIKSKLIQAQLIQIFLIWNHSYKRFQNQNLIINESVFTIILKTMTLWQVFIIHFKVSVH